MSDALHVRCLHWSPSTAIEDVRCRPDGTGCGQDETVRRPSLAFVRSGVFVKHVGRRRVLVDPGHVVFFRPGLDYRVSHPDALGDDCTAFTFDPEVVREVASSRVETAPPLSALAAPRLLLLQFGIRRKAASGTADALELDELCLELMRKALGRADRPSATRAIVFSGQAPSGPTQAARARLVDRVRQLLASRYTERWSLPALATEVGCSPFHLSRVFHRHAGLPLHRYLQRLRLRSALERLADPAVPLMALAHDLGFSSHGHFTVSFKREFGVTPSAARSGSSKILEA